MTLTTRLSAFFLATLACVLTGFAVCVFWLAHGQLEHDVDDRLETTFDTLISAAEVTREDVAWVPRELSLPRQPTDSPGREAVIWLVANDRQEVLDRSHSQAEALLKHAAPRDLQAPLSRAYITLEGETWRVAIGRLDRFSPHAHVSQHPSEATALKGDHEQRHRALLLVVATSWEPTAAALRAIGGVVAVLTLLFLGAALFGSRVVCRRALTPVSTMAAVAKEMRAADLQERLPVSKTGDELEDLSRAFNGLLDRLQDSFERQRRFTGDASHQLRTPLTIMRGHLEVALRRERSSDEYRQTLATVERQVSQLQHIVEALLVLARADEESQRPTLQPLDLASWLPEFVQSWADHPRASEITLQPLDSTAGRLVVQSHAVLLGELLNNLLDNATKYSPPGTAITLSAECVAEAVLIHIDDRGPGISATDLPHLFEPFYRARVSPTAAQPGTGLGLSIASRIARLLGGSLTAQSPSPTSLDAPPSGSRFTVSSSGKTCEEHFSSSEASP